MPTPKETTESKTILENSMSAQDQAKKSKQKPKVDKFLAKCDAKKDNAAEAFKLG